MAREQQQKGIARSIRIQQGMEAAAKEGRVPGPARTGYNSPDFCGVSAIDPVKGPIVRQLFTCLLAGESLRAAQRIAFQEGLSGSTGNLLSLATIHRMARDPFYTGLVRYGNEEYRGTHEALISVQEFNNLQDEVGYPQNKIRPQK